MLAYKTAMDEAQDGELRKAIQANYDKAAAKLQRQNKAYNSFCKENNLKPLSDRTSVANWNRSTALQATAGAKRYASSQNKVENSADSEAGISGKKSERTETNTVDLEYINSKEYHDKFKGITDNEVVNEQIYSQAKAILTHRNGTDKEDLCLIDSATGKIVATQNQSQKDYQVEYTNSLEKVISSKPKNSLIALHNHSTNNPPTGSDFVSAGKRGYKLGVIAAHNGKVFTYKVGEHAFLSTSFGNRVDKYRSYVYNLSEYEAIIKTLDDYKEQYGLDWREL